MDQLTFRPLGAGDLPAVGEVERMSFPSPWNMETFESTLGDERCLSMVALSGGEVVGYCVALHLTSMVHILNLAVAPAWRGKGVGRRLVEEVLARSASAGKACAVLEVRASNHRARTLYASLGFVQVSTWRGYYTDTNEDASIMVKDLRRKQVLDVACTVVSNTQVAPATWHLVIEGVLPQADPGQFVMVRVGESSDPFLRRPLAVMSQKTDCMELLYRVKGAGTLELSGKVAGDRVMVLGPLGRGFTVRSADRIVCLAGGTGLPPMISLAQRLASGVFIVGAKTKEDICLLERLSGIGTIELVVMTEDGSAGAKGLATDALEGLLADVPDSDEVVIYACGPEGMLRSAAGMAARRRAYCEVSLEERMGCGFGVCSGCVVTTTRGKERVCREGPVFDASEILWG